MKKKIIVCALLVICLSLIAYSTTAFLTYTETATNVITTGGVDIELLESSSESETSEGVAVHPATEVAKTVQVKNTGNQSAWLRISVETVITLSQEINATADVSLVSFDINTEDWTEKDGYYYYNQQLLPDEITEPLFTTVFFSEKMDNTYKNSFATIKVFAYATQVKNNGSTVFEAAGWPEADIN